MTLRPNATRLSLRLALLLAACDRARPAPPPRLVETMVLSANDGATAKTYPGQVVARYQVDLGFRLPGRMIAKLVDVGTPVRAGQALARLDPADVRTTLDSATAQTGAAGSAAEQQRVDLARARRLLADGFISQAEFDRKKVGVDQSAAQLRAARAQQTNARHQLDYTVLRAERAGVVAAFHADVGQVVAAGQPIATLASPGERDVAISVPEGEVERFCRAALRVHIWQQGGPGYAGRIRTLSPVANPQTRTFEARVAFDGDPQRSLVGSTAEVATTTSEGGNAMLRVPLNAVTKIAGRPAVWLVSGQPAHVVPRAVTIVAPQQNGLLVRGALRPGDRIVTAGVHLLHPGDRVRIAAGQDDAP